MGVEREKVYSPPSPELTLHDSVTLQLSKLVTNNVFPSDVTWLEDGIPIWLREPATLTFKPFTATWADPGVGPEICSVAVMFAVPGFLVAVTVASPTDWSVPVGTGTPLAGTNATFSSSLAQLHWKVEERNKCELES